MPTIPLGDPIIHFTQSHQISQISHKKSASSHKIYDNLVHLLLTRLRSSFNGSSSDFLLPLSAPTHIKCENTFQSNILFHVLQHNLFWIKTSNLVEDQKTSIRCMSHSPFHLKNRIENTSLNTSICIFLLFLLPCSKRAICFCAVTLQDTIRKSNNK